MWAELKKNRVHRDSLLRKLYMICSSIHTNYLLYIYAYVCIYRYNKYTHTVENFNNYNIYNCLINNNN